MTEATRHGALQARVLLIAAALLGGAPAPADPERTAPEVAEDRGVSRHAGVPAKGDEQGKRSVPKSPENRQRVLIEAIEQEQSRGARSEDLIGPLTALALLHQENGDHALAASAIERAVQVVRFNYGLYSLDQTPLLRQWIDNEEARGNLRAAWDLEQDLLTLARRHSEDLRTVPILREIADRRIDVLRRYLDGEYPAQITGCFYDESRDTRGGCSSWGRLDVTTSILSAAMRNYANAIAVILRNEVYSSDQLRELEIELIRSIDLIRHRHLVRRRKLVASGGHVPIVASAVVEPWRSRVDAVAQLAGWDIQYWYDGTELETDELREREVEAARRNYLNGNNYSLGRLSLRRLLAYEIANSSPWPNQVEGLIQLADWDLLHSRSGRLTGSAVATYEQAYRLARERGIAQAWIDETFSPKTPIVLPTFWPNPLDTEETAESTGYIDVAFDVTQDGRSRRIEIVSMTTNATRGDKNALIRLIERSRFRPRVTGGRLGDDSVVVRYYF